jgi:hypothetical protein
MRSCEREGQRDIIQQNSGLDTGCCLFWCRVALPCYRSQHHLSTWIGAVGIFTGMATHSTPQSVIEDPIAWLLLTNDKAPYIQIKNLNKSIAVQHDLF